MKFLKLVLIVAVLQFVQVNGWFLWWKKTQATTTKALPPMPPMTANLSDTTRRT